MRELLLAIQSALRSGLDSTVYRIGSNPEQSDIFIADNEQYLPSACMFPAVGIKDGGEVITRTQQCPGNTTYEEHDSTVQLICWAPSLSPKIGGGVIGDVTQPGVLDIAEHVRSVLANNLLGLDGVVDVKRTAIPGSSTTNQDGRYAQSLIVPYVYNREITYAD